MAARIVQPGIRQAGRRLSRRAAGAACWLAGRLATCCKLARQGRHAAGGHWVIWVIWVTVLNCKLAALANDHWVIWVTQKAMTQMTQKRRSGAQALGHLGHFVTQ